MLSFLVIALIATNLVYHCNSSALRFITRPQDVYTYNNYDAVFICQAEGATRYNWTKANVWRKPRGPRWQPTGDTLTYSSVKRSDNGTVINCGAINQTTVIYSRATLYVYWKKNATHPIITGGPRDITTVAGTNVSFNCTSCGILSDIRWKLDGITLITLPNFRKITTVYNGLCNTSILTLYRVNTESSGVYVCEAFGTIKANKGSDSRHATLTVTEAPAVIDYPDEITYVLEGYPLLLECHFSGYPIPSVIWYDGSGRVVNKGSVWSLPRVVVGLEGEYTCFGNNSVDGISSGEFRLIVQYRPIIHSSFQNMMTIHAGSTLELFCNATGQPLPTISWYKDNDILNSTDLIHIQYDRLTIENVSLSDEGLYRCLVRNPFGNISLTTSVALIPPSKPTGLDVENILHDRATLSWTPLVEYVYPILRFDLVIMDVYNIYFYTNQSIPTSSLTTVNNLSEYTLGRLVPYTFYSIIIQAHNDIGGSEFSAFPLFRTKTYFPSPPTISSRNITPFSVDIFLVVDRSNLNGPYRGMNFTISSLKNNFSKTTAILTAQLSNTYTQDNLIPFHRYTITASSFNGDYYSNRPSNDSFRTLEYSPTSPPNNLHVICSSPSTCILAWEAPIKSNGIITSYTLTIVNVNMSQSHINSISVNNESYTAKNLKPFSLYSWEIFASTIVGSGPAFSHHFNTPQGVPSGSPKLDVHTINSTAIQLAWPPLDEDELNGVFHNYQIIYTFAGISGKVIRTRITEANSLTLYNLTPYTDYGFTIKVNAGIGYGPSNSNPIHRLTTPALPEAVVEHLTATSHSPDSILLQWNPVHKTLIHAPTASYRVEMKSDVEWNTLQELIYRANHYLINDLLPNTLYTFRVQLFNERGSAPFTPEISTKTLQTIPGVPSLAGFIDKENPLLINISITPSSSTGNIIHYSVTVNSLGNATVESYSVSPLSMYDTTYFAYDATEYINFYKFTIFAKTNAGDSGSAVLLIETGETVPSRSPSELVIISQTSTSIYLAWDEIPREFWNGHLIGYQIRYRPSSLSEWTYLNITPSEYRYVMDLEMFTNYSFQVAGVTIDTGAYSLPAFERTFPGRPSVVKNLRVIRSESKLLEIEWDQPDQPNGIISSYRVQVIEVQQNSYTFYSGEKSRFTILNLKPYTHYGILIAATNQILTGKFSVRFDLMTDEGTPSEPYFSHVIQESRQLTVFWHSPQDPNGIIIDYNLACIRKKSNFTTRITVLHETDEDFYSTTCKGLSPNSKYKLKLFARNSVDSNWSFVWTQTDFLPPILSNISSSPQPVNNNNNLFTLPAFTHSNISFYLVVVIIFDSITTDVDDLSTNYSLTELKSFSSVFDTSLPYPYIAANLTPSEYSEFEIGDGEVYGGFENVPISNGYGYGYTFYILACVKSIKENSYLATSSSLSQPIIITRESPSNTSLAVIVSIVASSTVFLCLLICLLLIIVLVFCARVRSKQLEEENIPFKPCDTELSTVPWSANLSFKKIPKGSDPITYYRSVMNDPHLDARAPVPAYMLPKILENLLEDNEERLSEEYTHLTPIDTSTTNTATLNANAKKNRYLNILPYDHNRVSLSKPDSDYINASFIDSADRKNAYIATQGPTEATLEDFWQMVYDQHIQCLVMITKLKENAVEKCIQYWPGNGTNFFGKHKVTLNSTAYYCDYIIRELTLGRINSKESPRIIYHFQFLSWPDHRVPLHAMPMLNFIKRVNQTLLAKQINTQHPLLVHCSAGVGRTGTFIVLDSMMKRMLNGKEIDVFGHVSYLRTQRMFMVQGEDQYLFIFKVLTECYTSQKTSIQLYELENIGSILSMVIPDTQITGFDSEFSNLEIEYDEDNFTTATACINQQKNRHAQIIPLESSRVILPIINEQIGSDYINASLIDGYTHRQQFIATQTPLGETIADFWRMIWHYNSSIIVMLNSACNELDPCYYPEKLQIYDKYQVEKTSERSNKDYLYQQFAMKNLNSGEMRNINHFQYSSSSEGNYSISAKALLILCQEIVNMYQSQTPNATGPITVHCTNGSGNTGMLIAVINILEEMKESETVNIFQTVRYLRLQRPYMVETVEQYQLVYEAILQQAKTQLDNNVNKSKTRDVKTSHSDEISLTTSPVKMSTFARAGASISSWSSFQNRLSYTNTYRSSQISANSAFSNPDAVLEISD